MMGLQVNKRKFHVDSYDSGPPAAKNSRLHWPPPAEDSIAKLQAVAVPGEAWTLPSAPQNQFNPSRSVLVTSILEDNFEDEEDELDYDYEDELPIHQHWFPPVVQQSQQTIRCAENGKSYLELGGVNYVRPNNRQFYRERRMRMMNLSMCKLARFRQCPDPPLRRSVLICNTLRSIEREMEDEEQQQNAFNNVCWQGSNDSGRSTPYPMPTPPPVIQSQPVSQAPDCDSGYSDDESGKSIDWGSVLSLSALDPIVPSAEDDFADLLPSWRLSSELTDLDSPQRIMVRS